MEITKKRGVVGHIEKRSEEAKMHFVGKEGPLYCRLTHRPVKQEDMEEVKRQKTAAEKPQYGEGVTAKKRKCQLL